MFKIANLRTIALGFALVAGSIGAAQAGTERPTGYAAGSTGYVGTPSNVQHIAATAPVAQVAQRLTGYAAGSTGYVGKAAADRGTTASVPDAPRRYALGSTGVVLYPEGPATANSAVATR